jgi:hypothetical protein
MKCKSCGKCISLTEKNGVYEINCAEKEQFKLHSDFLENFTCEDFEEVVTPPKDNVLIILKSGREFAIYDEKVKSKDDIDSWLKENEWVSFGVLTFRTSEIACYGYIG